MLNELRLNQLRDEALRIAREHGFKDATQAEDIALIHSEASEALEDIRDGHAPTDVWYEEKVMAFVDGPAPVYAVIRHKEQDIEKSRKPCGIPSEMADIIIRVLHFCGKHEIDIEKAVIEKMAYNDSRPFKHGKKL